MINFAVKVIGEVWGAGESTLVISGIIKVVLGRKQMRFPNSDVFLNLSAANSLPRVIVLIF